MQEQIKSLAALKRYLKPGRRLRLVWWSEPCHINLTVRPSRATRASFSEEGSTREFHGSFRWKRADCYQFLPQGFMVFATDIDPDGIRRYAKVMQFEYVEDHPQPERNVQ